MVNVTTWNVVSYQKSLDPDQTASSEDHEEAVWSGSSYVLFWQAFFSSSSENQYMYLIEKTKRKVFGILVHLPYTDMNFK